MSKPVPKQTVYFFRNLSPQKGLNLKPVRGCRALEITSLLSLNCLLLHLVKNVCGKFSLKLLTWHWIENRIVILYCPAKFVRDLNG